MMRRNEGEEKKMRRSEGEEKEKMRRSEGEKKEMMLETLISGDDVSMKSMNVDEC